MDIDYYLDTFQKSLDIVDKPSFEQRELALKVGVWMDSVVLKIQKPAWLNNSAGVKPFEESIFFSVWVGDATLKQSELCYNIHALKIRELPAYKIKSREFAEAFRTRFKPFEPSWPNVGTQYAPHTLMQGWVQIDPDNMARQIAGLAHRFLEVVFIIDDLLEERRK